MSRFLQVWSLSLLCIALWPAHPAMAGEPRVEPFAHGATARLRFQVEREHSCSQSFENRTQTGTVTFEVTRGGEATLTLEVREVTMFGPSLGSYKQGQRDFHNASEKHRTVWRGKASSHGDQLSAQLLSVSSAGTALPEFGDAEYPPATTHATEGFISCTLSMLLPPPPDPLASPGEGEGQEPPWRLILRCRMDDLPDLLDNAISGEGGLPLGLGETLLLEGSDVQGDRRVVLRPLKPGEEEEQGSGEKPAGAGE